MNWINFYWSSKVESRITTVVVDTLFNKSVLCQWYAVCEYEKHRCFPYKAHCSSIFHNYSIRRRHIDISWSRNVFTIEIYFHEQGKSFTYSFLLPVNGIPTTNEHSFNSIEEAVLTRVCDGQGAMYQKKCRLYARYRNPKTKNRLITIVFRK